MNLEELTKLVEEAEEYNKKGNFNETEVLINKLLTDKLLDQDLLLKSRALSDLSWALLNQGNLIESLPIAELSLDYAISCKTENHIEATKAEATALNCFGIVYLNFSDYLKALEYLSCSLILHEEIGNRLGVANTTSNIGIIYNNLSVYPKALEYYSLALSLYQEIGNKNGVANALCNIGNVYVELSDYTKAIEYYNRAIFSFDEIGDKNGVANAIGNVGKAYGELSDYPKALEYFSRALSLYEEIGNKMGMTTIFSFFGYLYSVSSFDGFDPIKAEEFLLKSIDLCVEIGTKEVLYENYKALSDLYVTLFRWEEALSYFKLFHDLEKEVQTEEAKNKAEQFDFERKQADIDKQLAVERAKHEATEALLHNVLPISIANRMIKGEHLIAEKLENVSVLFADIVNFTQLSQSISPEQLVDGLDRIFTAFDLLADKYNLEKIKTIGDAYMVVSGAPIPRIDHAQVMANMALDMIETMKQFKSISTGEQIHIRIGIHSGDVVAGVIGKRKFAYDLWGDAVNTASRMESHGEPNQIHISQDFYNELINSNLFSIDNFIDRGKMEVKGKGVLKTYFLIKS